VVLSEPDRLAPLPASARVTNLAEGRRFKRRNLSTIHPQEGRLVCADHITVLRPSERAACGGHREYR
jgi:hypothetical protein